MTDSRSGQKNVRNEPVTSCHTKKAIKDYEGNVKMTQEQP